MIFPFPDIKPSSFIDIIENTLIESNIISKINCINQIFLNHLYGKEMRTIIKITTLTKLYEGDDGSSERNF